MKKITYLHFSKLHSTSTWIKENLQKLDPKTITCVSSDEQTAGYGQKKRKWISKKGNLHMSLFFQSQQANHNLAQYMTLATSSICKRKGVETQIKWPNDLMLNRKKIGGVLAEVINLENEEKGVIIGLGLDVHEKVKTDQPTSSIFEATQETWDLSPLRNEITNEFFSLLKQPFCDFVEVFNQKLAFKGENITFKAGNASFVGLCCCINSLGHLEILLENGEKKSFASGEISLIRPYA